jgi:chemosensory pili system protein ChpC
MSQGLPQLVRVNPSVVSGDDDGDWPPDSPVVCRIRMINEYPLVPDLEGIERLLNAVSERWH